MSGGWLVLIHKVRRFPLWLWQTALTASVVPLVIVCRLVRPWWHVRFGFFTTDRIGHFTFDLEYYLSERSELSPAAAEGPMPCCGDSDRRSRCASGLTPCEWRRPVCGAVAAPEEGQCQQLGRRESWPNLSWSDLPTPGHSGAGLSERWGLARGACAL